MCKGVHFFEQYSDEQITGDLVFLYRTGFQLRDNLDERKLQQIEASLDSLRPFGTYVTYGNASGPVEAMRPLVLAQGGSLFLTRPRLGDHYADPHRGRS